jgi:DNA primase
MEFVKRRKAIESVFGRTSVSSDGINCAVSCPACNEKNKKNKLKLIIRLDDGRYQCWVCGAKGNNIAFFASKHKTGVNALFEIFGKKTKKSEVEPQEELKLPDASSFLLNKKLDPDQKATVRYVTSRGLSHNDFYRWRLMYSSSRSYRRRVIVPSFDSDGNLNYYVARSIDEDRKPRYMNSRVPKNDVIFNEIDVDWNRPVVLVEGVFDAMKCGNNVIPILGSTLSKRSRLYAQLTRHACGVTLSLDPDLKQKSYAIANDLARDGCDVSISFAPADLDLGAMQKQEARKVISNRIAYDPMNALRLKIKNIKSGSVF